MRRYSELWRSLLPWASCWQWDFLSGGHGGLVTTNKCSRCSIRTRRTRPRRSKRGSIAWTCDPMRTFTAKTLQPFPWLHCAAAHHAAAGSSDSTSTRPAQQRWQLGGRRDGARNGQSAAGLLPAAVGAVVMRHWTLPPLLCTQFYRNRMLCRPLLLIRSGSMLLLQVVFLGCYGESGKLLNVVAKWPTTSTPPMALSARNATKNRRPTPLWSP